MHLNIIDKRCDNFVQLNFQSIIQIISFEENINLVANSKKNKLFINQILFYKFTWKMTRDFSKRYTSISAPAIFPVLPKWIRINFPWRKIIFNFLLFSSNQSIRKSYKTRWIIISSCFGISICFQNRIYSRTNTFDQTLNFIVFWSNSLAETIWSSNVIVF